MSWSILTFWFLILQNGILCLFLWNILCIHSVFSCNWLLNGAGKEIVPSWRMPTLWVRVVTIRSGASLLRWAPDVRLRGQRRTNNLAGHRRLLIGLRTLRVTSVRDNLSRTLRRIRPRRLAKRLLSRSERKLQRKVKAEKLLRKRKLNRKESWPKMRTVYRLKWVIFCKV